MISLTLPKTGFTVQNSGEQVSRSHDNLISAPVSPETASKLRKRTHFSSYATWNSTRGEIQDLSGFRVPMGPGTPGSVARTFLIQHGANLGRDSGNYRISGYRDSVAGGQRVFSRKSTEKLRFPGLDWFSGSTAHPWRSICPWNQMTHRLHLDQPPDTVFTGSLDVRNTTVAEPTGMSISCPGFIRNHHLNTSPIRAFRNSLERQFITPRAIFP